MPELQNLVIVQIYAISCLLFAGYQLSMQEIDFNFVYDNTPTGSPLRSLVVSMFNCFETGSLLDSMADLPREMVLDLYVSLREYHGNTDCHYLTLDRFHVSTAVPTRCVVKTK
jgi:uncharacterized protein YfbU (UPF0304 family)